MELRQGINRIRKVLEDKEHSSDYKLEMIGYSLPEDWEYRFISHKSLLLAQARESGDKYFRLLATMNDMINIFNWCESEYNFLGMSVPKGFKKHKVEYTLDELPDAIDNAERYLKELKEDKSFSGSPYFISHLQLMSY